MSRILPSGYGASKETTGGWLRRSYVAAQRSNPLFSTTRLVGSVPWIAGGLFSGGQVVSNGGFVYYAASGGTAGTTPPTHITGTVSDGGINWTFWGVQTAPVVSQSASHNAALSLTFTPPGSNPDFPSDRSSVFRVVGGTPFSNGNQAGIPGFQTDLMLSTGNLGGKGAGESGYCSWQSCYQVDFEGDILEFKGIFFGAGPILIRVNGVPLDYAFTPVAGGFRYVTLDFTNCTSAQAFGTTIGRSIYQIEITFGMNQNTASPIWVVSASCKPTSNLSYPSVADNRRLYLLGDSQSEGYDLAASWNAYALQLQNLLGVEIVNDSIAGTGIVATASNTAANYQTRALKNLAVHNGHRPIAGILIQPSSNDTSYASNSGINSAMSTLLQTLRGAFPGVPIISLGALTGGSNASAQQAAQLGNESAVLAAVTQQQARGDLNTFGITLASDPLGPDITGTGRVGTVTGNGGADFDIDSGGLHRTVAGHCATALRQARALGAIWSAMP